MSSSKKKSTWSNSARSSALPATPTTRPAVSSTSAGAGAGAGAGANAAAGAEGDYAATDFDSAASTETETATSTSTSTATAPRLTIAAIVLIVAATVAFLPGAMNRWVLPKEVVLAVGVVLAACVPAVGRLPRWLLALVGVAVVMLAVAALAGSAPLSQVMGRWPRFEGLVTLPVYFAAAWAGARMLGPRVSASVLRAFYVTVALSAIAIGVVAILEAFGLRPISSDLDRPGSLLGNATDQGVVGVMFAAVLVLPALRAVDARGGASAQKVAARGVGARAAPSRMRAADGTVGRASAAGDAPAGVDRHEPRWYRAALVAGLAFAVIGVVTSASRAAVAALFVVAIIVGVAEVRRRASGARLRTAMIAVGVLVGIAVFVVLVPLTRDRVVSTATTSVGSLGDRFAIWGEALGLFWATPLVGVGPSGFMDAISARHTTTWFAEVGEGVTLDSPHLWILQAGLAGGIVVLLAAVGLAVAVAVTGVRRLRAARAHEGTEPVGPHERLVAGALLALLGYAAVLLTHFTAPATTTFAAVLVGAVVAKAPVAASGGVPSRARAGRMIGVALLGVWAVALLVTCAAEIPLKAGVDAAAAGRLANADSSFAAAAALRPWDADVPLIAAQSFAAAADAEAASRSSAGGAPGAGGGAAAESGADGGSGADGDSGANGAVEHPVADGVTADQLTLEWAQRALDRLPDSVLAAKALAVGQQYAGDAPAAVATLAALNDRAANDPDTLHRLGGMLYVTGDAAGAERALIEATTLDPSDKNAWLTLQYVAQQLGDQATADRATTAIAGLGG